MKVNGKDYKEDVEQKKTFGSYLAVRWSWASFLQKKVFYRGQRNESSSETSRATREEWPHTSIDYGKIRSSNFQRSSSQVLVTAFLCFKSF